MEKAELKKIARIARLRLSEAEEKELQKEIADILSAFENLKKLSQKSKEFSYMTPSEGKMRKDGNPVDGGEMLENASKKENGFLKVPKGI